MTMQEHLDACRRRAFEMKATHPDIIHTKLLDLAAQSLGYAHYTALQKLLKVLGPDTAPSRAAITLAGGAPAASPLRPIEVAINVPWGENLSIDPTPIPPLVTHLTEMSGQDVRAVIERCYDLTRFGLGVSSSKVIQLHGSYRKALEAGQEELIEHLDECNKALRFLSHVEKRKSINPKAGSSYGLKHSAEYFLDHLSDGPKNTYVANGAFICAALHLGFDHRPIQLGSPNVYFNISSRSPIFEWRSLENRSSILCYEPKAQKRYQELKEMLGIT